MGVVKVDPDTVFFPGMLSLHLRSKYGQLAALAGTQGVYVQNCLVAGKLQFFGSTEVLSRAALRRYAARGLVCNSEKDPHMGEDMWMQNCLDKLQVVALKDSEILRDGYCPADKGWQPSHCRFSHAAYHPRKTVSQWW